MDQKGIIIQASKDHKLYPGLLFTIHELVGSKIKAYHVGTKDIVLHEFNIDEFHIVGKAHYIKREID